MVGLFELFEGFFFHVGDFFFFFGDLGVEEEDVVEEFAELPVLFEELDEAAWEEEELVDFVVVEEGVGFAAFGGDFGVELPDDFLDELLLLHLGEAHVDDALVLVGEALEVGEELFGEADVDVVEVEVGEVVVTFERHGFFDLVFFALDVDAVAQRLLLRFERGGEFEQLGELVLFVGEGGEVLYLLGVEELGELAQLDEAPELDQTHQAPAEPVFAHVDAFFEDLEEVLPVLDDAVVDAHFEPVQELLDLAQLLRELLVAQPELVSARVDARRFEGREFVGVGDELLLEVLGHVGEVVGRGLCVDALAFEVLFLRFHLGPFRDGGGWDVVEEGRDLGVGFVVVDVEGVALDFGDDFVGRVEDGGLFVFGLVDFVDDFVDGLCEELFVGFFFVEFLAEVGEVGFEVLFDFDFVAHEVAVEVDAGLGEVVVGVVIGFECVEVELFFVEVHVLVENGGLFFFDFEEEFFEFGDFVEVL